MNKYFHLILWWRGGRHTHAELPSTLHGRYKPIVLPCLVNGISVRIAITHIRELLLPIFGKAVKGKKLPSFSHTPANDP